MPCMPTCPFTHVLASDQITQILVHFRGRRGETRKAAGLFFTTRQLGYKKRKKGKVSVRQWRLKSERILTKEKKERQRSKVKKKRKGKSREKKKEKESEEEFKGCEM